MKITSFVKICANLVQTALKWTYSYTNINKEKWVIDIPVRQILLPIFATRSYTPF